ncbi:MAG: carboxymuconolactone decarboxylase family protein [Pseudomonadota bacterium]|nr:carboxymuconolactone decarboxylase family protein [Pseudomonadota bacterium]
MSDRLSDSGLLRRYAPYTLAGYGLFREITDRDGAVSARMKALFIAVAAIAKHHEALALEELRRGAGLGLELKEAVAGLIVLSSLRGEGTALAFQKLIEQLYPEARAPQPPVPAIAVAEGEALGNFTEYFGTVPPPLAMMLKLLPKGADAYYLMRKGSINSNPLSPKFGELLLLAVLAADYSPMSARHVEGARKAGASDEEIAETIVCAIPAGGIAAWMAAAPLLAAP